MSELVSNTPVAPRRDAWADAAFEWWQTLTEQDGKRSGPNLRGDRAELRRAREAADVYANPSFHALLRRLGANATADDRLARAAAVLAAILARVERHQDGGFARQAAAGEDGPNLSELRFRRLLQKQTAEELQGDLGRALHVLDKTADVRDLARSILRWNDETRRRWAFDYFQYAKLG